jgi:DHA2 family multidrug resistance protein
MIASLMTMLDTTIANVALPRIAGSMSASAEQTTWVLTSYIIATAIMTPMTGWLAGRLGRKQVFLIAIVGFTAASALCGAAQSLDQIVLCRVLQGVFGAAVMPLSQAVMIDTYPIAERGLAMAVWGMGVTVAPILGPVLGGWLTDDFSWRWVFYINLPVGLLSVLGVMTFIPDDRSALKLPFDLMGFALLSIALAAFQLCLDRGQSNDWFASAEVAIEASVSAVALVLFIIHSLTIARPFLPLELLGDRNFVMATALGLLLALLSLSVLALLPTMIETLFGYPVMATGLVMAPRGIGALISSYVAGRLIGRVDNRPLILTGLALFAVSFHIMSHSFSLAMDSAGIAITGLLQGLGAGLVFTPMTTLAFATLAPSLRADGAGVFTLIRNLGNSAGISIMQTLIITNSQVVHARLTERLTPDNPVVRAPYLAAPYSLTNPTGLRMLDGEINRQSAMVAYVDIFHLMFLITVILSPLILLLRSAPVRDEEVVILE